MDKSSVSFTWTAPAEGSGYVSFRFAVVQTTPVYWANEDGGTLLGGLASEEPAALILLVY